MRLVKLPMAFLPKVSHFLNGSALLCLCTMWGVCGLAITVLAMDLGEDALDVSDTNVCWIMETCKGIFLLSSELFSGSCAWETGDKLGSLGLKQNILCTSGTHVRFSSALDTCAGFLFLEPGMMNVSTDKAWMASILCEREKRLFESCAKIRDNNDVTITSHLTHHNKWQKSTFCLTRKCWLNIFVVTKDFHCHSNIEKHKFGTHLCVFSQFHVSWFNKRIFGFCLHRNKKVQLCQLTAASAKQHVSQHNK